MEFLYTLPFLACPIAMGLMMWFMMRPRHKDDAPVGNATQEREIARLRAQVDQLRAEQQAGTRSGQGVRLGKP